MQIHNLMQDYVIKRVEDLFQEEIAKGNTDFCRNYQCKLDVICFVLNRVRPEYVISGRGLAHHEVNYQDKLQKEADITALIWEAIEIVSKGKRPSASTTMKEKPSVPQGDFFNFPSIMGRLFNGTNFCPISETKISLWLDGELVKSIDDNWLNPYEMVPSTAGTYTFWPYPVKAAYAGQSKTFSFEIKVEDDRFEPLYHYFDLTIEAKDTFLEFFQINESYKIKDLTIFPVENEVGLK
ncbi:late competence development ComFB family protein [Spirochaeta cellobiosiphila]|uniref:late competence development ComFB family protein n=1 Tax=Spirochaeta cellobiosiphila TaxID=504483 RepID=UPI00040A6FC3|nr:late competence development ComFB family protein [Spirochaeta cellobiosiphila]